MNRARAALCGLALAACASGAAADDDYEALFARCVGSVIETHLAMAAEFPGPGSGGFEQEAALLALRKMQADPGAALRSEFIFGLRGNAEVVSDVCAMADFWAGLLDAMRRDDKAAGCRLLERYDERLSFGEHDGWSSLREKCDAPGAVGPSPSSPSPSR